MKRWFESFVSGAGIDIREEIEVLEAAVREAQSVQPARVVVVDPPRLSRILAALKEAQKRASFLEECSAENRGRAEIKADKLEAAEAKLARAVELLDDASDAVHFLAMECANKEAAELGRSIAAFLQEIGK
jgi:hypothetical protein